MTGKYSQVSVLCSSFDNLRTLLGLNKSRRRENTSFFHPRSSALLLVASPSLLPDPSIVTTSSCPDGIFPRHSLQSEPPSCVFLRRCTVVSPVLDGASCQLDMKSSDLRRRCPAWGSAVNSMSRVELLAVSVLGTFDQACASREVAVGSRSRYCQHMPEKQPMSFPHHNKIPCADLATAPLPPAVPNPNGGCSTIHKHPERIQHGAAKAFDGLHSASYVADACIPSPHTLVVASLGW